MGFYTDALLQVSSISSESDPLPAINLTLVQGQPMPAVTEPAELHAYIHFMIKVGQAHRKESFTLANLKDRKQYERSFKYYLKEAEKAAQNTQDLKLISNTKEKIRFLSSLSDDHEQCFDQDFCQSLRQDFARMAEDLEQPLAVYEYARIMQAELYAQSNQFAYAEVSLALSVTVEAKLMLGKIYLMALDQPGKTVDEKKALWKKQIELLKSLLTLNVLPTGPKFQLLKARTALLSIEHSTISAGAIDKFLTSAENLLKDDALNPRPFCTEKQMLSARRLWLMNKPIEAWADALKGLEGLASHRNFEIEAVMDAVLKDILSEEPRRAEVYLEDIKQHSDFSKQCLAWRLHAVPLNNLGETTKNTLMSDETTKAFVYPKLKFITPRPDLTRRLPLSSGAQVMRALSGRAQRSTATAAPYSRTSTTTTTTTQPATKGDDVLTAFEELTKINMLQIVTEEEASKQAADKLNLALPSRPASTNSTEASASTGHSTPVDVVRSPRPGV